MKMLRRLPASASLVVFTATATVAVAIALTATADTPPVPVPPANADAAATAVARARADVQKPQRDVLDAYNSGTRDYRKLTVREVEGATLKPDDLNTSSALADSVVVVTVTGLKFEWSEMQDFPGARITYRVEQSLKGSIGAGDSFEIAKFGGPYKDARGEYFVQLSTNPVDLPGQRLLLFLSRTEGGGFFVHDQNGRFDLTSGTVGGNPSNLLLPGLKGTSAQQFVTDVRAAVAAHGSP